MATLTIEETPRQRHKRYTEARSRAQRWFSLWDSAYTYTLPLKNNFQVKRTPGEPRHNEIFDATAIEGLQGFANNMQSILMPPLRRWATFAPGTAVKEEDQNTVKKNLSAINDKFFAAITQSNLALTINETFQELGIGTGVLLLNEGTDDDPLIFTAIPLTDVVVEEGENHKLENFWRLWEEPARLIKRRWPDATLTTELDTKVKNSPDKPVKLIEGTIFYPNNPEDKRYLYYVQTANGVTDIFTEWRDFSPWIGFRFSRAPGETFGRGPVLQALPFIKQLNKTVELVLLGAQYRITPPFLVASSGAMNPYTINILPGSQIAVDATATLAGGLPIQTLEYGGDINFTEAWIERLQAQIRDILFANPLGPVTGPQMTATEVSIRQQEAIKKIGAAFGRLLVELLEPIIQKSLKILQKKGLIPGIKLNNTEISIRYESPLAQLQNQEDMRAVEQWVAFLLQTYGNPEGLAPVQFDILPQWAAEKLNVPSKLVNEQFATSPLISKLKQVIGEGVQPPAPQGQAPGVPQPAPQATVGQPQTATPQQVPIPPPGQPVTPGVV